MFYWGEWYVESFGLCGKIVEFVVVDCYVYILCFLRDLVEM